MVCLLDQVSHASGARPGSVSESNLVYSHTNTLLKKPNPQLYQGCLPPSSPHTSFLGGAEGAFCSSRDFLRWYMKTT